MANSRLKQRFLGLMTISMPIFFWPETCRQFVTDAWDIFFAAKEKL
ncbi:MAG: hypothetical protein KKE64_00910 [Candidatus Omnitrophica bacterium]|nr:hypothetical protein [Candidatus Omnitrophota bacterium]